MSGSARFTAEVRGEPPGEMRVCRCPKCGLPGRYKMDEGPQPCTCGEPWNPATWAGELWADRWTREKEVLAMAIPAEDK